MELFDLYDDNRLPLGRALPRGSALATGENRMVIHICIFNSRNEMLIQQRVSTKSFYPSVWDISAGGNCVSGESSQDSAHRELLEELGIDYDFSATRPYFTINFEHGFDDFYLLSKDIDISTITLQAEEVANVKWASMDEILKLYDEGVFLPYPRDFLIALFTLKNKRGLFD